MTNLIITPMDKAFDVSPGTPIVVVGNIDSGVATFDYTTLYVGLSYHRNGVFGDYGHIFQAGQAVRPDWAARLIRQPQHFSLTIQPRRQLLHRVNYSLAASIHDSSAFVATAAGGFIVSDRPVQSDVAKFLSVSNPEPSYGGAVALQTLDQISRFHASGSFQLEVLRRLWVVSLTSLWPILRALFKFLGTLEQIDRVVPRYPEGMENFDYSFFTPQDNQQQEIIWDAAVDQYRLAGGSESMAALLTRVFRAPSVVERMGAVACLLLMASILTDSNDPVLIETAKTRRIF